MTDTLSVELPKAELRHWSTSAVMALVAHGLAVVMLLPRTEFAIADAGSPVVMIEFAPQIAAPAAPPLDLPPGPLQTSAQAEEQARLERQAVRHTELKVEDKPIPEMRSPREPELASPKPVEAPTRQTRQDQHEQEAVAERPAATAPPDPMITAALPAGPVAGQTPTLSSRAFATWQLRLVAHLERFKRYPRDARPAQGVVNIAFTIDRKGALLDARIAKSSGSARLDAEALSMVRRAQPLPAPPPETADSQLSQVAPIRFVTE